MLPVWLVISAIFVGCCCGHFQEANSTQIPCGIDKICVPAHSCRERESNVNDEPFLDPRSEFDVCGPTSKCCHINDQEQKSSSFGLVLPYFGLLPPKSYGIGKSIRIEGRVLLNPSYFFVNLQSGPNIWPTPPIAFQFSPRYKANGRHVIYIFSAKGQRKDSNAGLLAGKSFSMDIVRRVTSYDVYVNKQLIAEIPIHVDAEAMDTVYVNGDIQLGHVAVQNYSSSIETRKALFRDYDNTTVVYSNNELGALLNTGLTVTGFILPVGERFAINLITSSNDIALHISVRLPENHIVWSSRVNNVWKKSGILKLPLRLLAGSRVVIQIVSTPDTYLVSVNGHHVGMLLRPLSSTSVASMEVIGDVDVTSFKRTEGVQYPERLPESEVKEIRIAADGEL